MIFENSADVIYTIDKDFKFLDVSPSITYWLGYKPEELIGKKFYELNIVDPSFLDTLIIETQKVFKGEKLYSVVFPVITKGGKKKWAEINAVPLYKDDKIVGEIAMGRDITKRVQAEMKARESEERYFKLMENLNVGILITNKEGEIIYYNKSILKSLNYTKQEFEKIRNASQLYFNPMERKKIIDLLEKEGYISNYKVLGKKKNGEPIEIILNLFPIRFRDQNCIQSIIYDVTDIQKKEIEIKEMKERYETFFMSDLTADYISTEEGKILTCNPAFLKIFGFSSLEEALKKNMGELFVNPEEREKVCSLIKENKKVENLEIKMKKLDGTVLEILANFVGIFDEYGNLIQIIGYLLDETKRKFLEENLRQAQTLESLGTLAGGIAHDFNNILNIILGHSELLERTYNPSTCIQEHKEYIKAIKDSSHRGISLVKQLLTFSRKTEPEISPCNINEIIMELQKLTFETFPRYIKINLNLRKDLPIILCDGNQIHQAILNLLVNSRDALPKGGEIFIKTDIVSGEKLAEKFPDATFDDYILIEVSDNGIGMDEKVLKSIFLPFFTTKELGKGTGLGLSLVYAIVKNHNGFIDVKSSLGFGTTFHIYLPIKKEIPIEYEEKMQYGEISKGEGKTILIIE
ncbi:MAG: PAS domain S-box protein, partial [Thermoanaerobaculia bacterium]